MDHEADFNDDLSRPGYYATKCPSCKKWLTATHKDDRNAVVGLSCSCWDSDGVTHEADRIPVDMMPPSLKTVFREKGDL
tara:strand:+ start:1370 stop:1606 length:237 start_codon:yes stop_codon:yes gene_type:complete